MQIFPERFICNYEGNRIEINLVPEVKVKVNGATYLTEGTIREVVRVAQMKYAESHFKQVDSLIINGSKIMAACADVAMEHGFSVEGFYRQYNDRHANAVKRGKLI